MKAIKQTDAADHIGKRLRERGLLLVPRSMILPDRTCWLVFDYRDKQIGVDAASGVWVRVIAGEWRCLAMPCSVSGAVQAVEFLVGGIDNSSYR